MTKRIFRGLVALAATMLVAACGGGGDGGGGVGSGGTGQTPQGGTTAGVVTGYGSVVVDGVRYDDSSASVSVEDNPASPRTGAIAEVRLGQQVELRFDASGRAVSISVQSEVVGRISSVSGTGFIVAGQQVVLPTDPGVVVVFDGARGLADLAVGTIVEVHGQRDASGAIVATRVEVKDPRSAFATRIVGQIAAVSGQSITVGSLNVNTAGANIVPAGTTFAVGQSVVVWSNQAIAGNTLNAQVVRLKAVPFENASEARLGGLVRELNAGARTFRIDGVAVNAASATFQNGTANDLANGRWLRVRGTFSNGVLVANEVRFVRSQGDARVEITGAITDFVSASSFKIRGVPIDASGASFRDGTAANLGNGVLVSVKGDVPSNDAVVRAAEVEFVQTGDDRSVWLWGTVTSYDNSANFRLAGLLTSVNMQLATNATFRNSNGSAATRAEFGNGDAVTLRGRFVGGVYVVDEVVFRVSAGVVVNRFEGIVYGFDGSGRTLIVNGVQVRIPLVGVTFVDGTYTDLANGVRVEIEASLSGGQLLASRVEIDTPGSGSGSGSSGSTLTVRGNISLFQSQASFRVAGQPVNASGAAFQGGTAADLANGKYVKAKGPVVNGVINATEVEFED